MSNAWKYSPGGTVVKGEYMRVTGGPVYKDHAGGRHAMGHRGVFRFVEHVVNGKDEYVVMAGTFGGVYVFPLRMGKPRWGISGYKNLPYRFRKVRKVRKK